MKRKLETNGKESPFVEINTKSIKAKYYYNGEGEVVLLLGGNDDFFYAYKDKLPDHIKEIKEYMADLNNQMTVCRNALDKLQKLSLPAPPKRIIESKKEPEIFTIPTPTS